MSTAPRRLYRSERDRMVAGVCGGLADYLGVDPVLVRVVFVILALVNGIGLLAYLVLALVVPRESAVTRTGEEVWRANVDELGHTARRMAEDARRAFTGQDKGRGASETGAEEPAAGVEAAPAGAGTEAADAAPTVVPAPPEADAGEVRRRRTAAAGIVLVGLGIVFLAQNLGLFWWVRGDVLWPLVLIAIGAALIWRRVRD